MPIEHVLGLPQAVYADFDSRNSQMAPLIGGQPIACGAGCSYCCHIEVGLGVSEVMLIKRYLETARRDRLEQIKTKLRHTRRQVGDMVGIERKAARVMCPLLDDHGSCLIYEVRPLSCRAFVSCDRSACEDDWNRPGDDVPVPQSATLHSWQDQIIPQFRQQEARLGLFPGGYELIRALHVAFATPSFERMCMTGQDVLVKATLRE